MSVRVTDIRLDTASKQAKVSLFADAKAEVTSGMTVIGLPEGYDIAPSSSVMTASAEVAFMKSDETWNWV